MARVDTLTAEQSAKLAQYREEWLRVGLSTEPTDRPAAERAVAEAYRGAGLEPPKIVIWLASPMAGAVGAAFLAELVKRGGDQVWAQVRDQVGAQVRAQVWDQVRDQVSAQVGDQVWDQVGAQVWDQVGAQVWDQVGDQVWDQVGAQVRDQVRAQVGSACYGQHDANWLGFYEFFWRECGLEFVAPLKGLIELARAVGWWWAFRGAVILTARPTALHRDDRGRLHCADGPALGYSDGWGIWSWHGVRVDRSLIEHPETITPALIDTQKNAEVRRIMIERFGIARYITESGAEVLHEDNDSLGFPRRLLRKPMGGELPDLTMVEVKNSTLEPDGTRKTYVLAVHPELRPLYPDGRFGGAQKEKTCHNAVASTFGLRGEEYRPEVET
jgi:hypothetical protein